MSDTHAMARLFGEPDWDIRPEEPLAVIWLGIHERAVVFVTYKSVYGDQWYLRSDNFVPVSGPAPRVP